MNEQLMNAVYDIVPDAANGFAGLLSHIGETIKKKLDKTSEDEIKDELYILGFLHSESEEIIEEIKTHLQDFNKKH